MAGRLTPPWPPHLEELLEALRQDGFRIGVGETMRLHQLLLALVERGVPLDDPERLASLLGPVLCRSASEQEAFQRHVARWWQGSVAAAAEQNEPPVQEPPEATPSSAAALREALEGVERRRRQWLRWLPTTPLGLVVAAGLVVGAGAGVVRLQQLWSPPPAARQAPANPSSPGPGLNNPRPKAPPPTDPAPTRPAAPQEAPIVLAREEGLLLLPAEMALLLAISSLLALAAVKASVRWWWWRQARLVLQRLQPRGELQLHRIALEVIEPELLALPDVHRLGRALKGWRRLPSAELDGAATVAESLRRGGWLSPRYGQRRERLSWLFLLDQESLVDQQTRHLRAWLERLRQEGVLADWACFQRQPVFCYGPSGLGPRRSLVELAALHPEAVAVVVADGERFFSPVDGTPLPWIEGLAAWPRHAALTPRPLSQWGAMEAELGRLLPVLPISPEGLRALGQLGETAAPPEVVESVSEAPPEPELLQGSPTPWLDCTPPAPEVVRLLLAQLRAYLGADGFTWLAACAVFPEMHWTITAYLGQRLRTASGEPLLRVCPLLRLARLPWFRHGYIPDWLRLPLILSLPPQRQGDVRAALSDLVLSAVEGGEVGTPQLRVATERPPGLRRLLPPLLELLRQRGGATSPLRDQLFLHFLQDRPLLAADAPESLRRLVPEAMASPWRWRQLWTLGPRGLAAAAALLLGVGALSLVAVRQAQLAWIGRLVEESGRFGSGPESVQRLQRAIMALGLSRSSLMRLGPDPELGRLEGALADRLSQPGIELMRLRGHKLDVRSVAFSPDGRLIASGGGDGTVRLWDARSGAATGSPLQGHAGIVRSVAISPDGRLIASGGVDGTVRLWEAKSGTPIVSPLQGHAGEGGVWSVAFSPDGRLIASGSDDRTLRLWDAKSGAPIGSPLKGHEQGVRSVAFSPDGRLIASGGGDGTVRLWDAKSGAPIGSPLKGHEGWVWSVAFSPDGRLIASGSDDRTLRLWDAKSGTAIGSPLKGHEGFVHAVAFSPDGRRIASGSRDETVRLWDAAADGDRVTALMPLGDAPIDTGQKGVTSLLQLNTGEWISGGVEGTLRRWRNGKPLGNPIPTGQGGVLSLTQLKNGEWISGGEDGTLRRWRDGTALGQPIPIGKGVVLSLTELNNGEWITGGVDGTLRRWRNGTAFGQPIPTGQGALLSLYKRKNGELVSAGADGTLRRWRDGKAVVDATPIASGQAGLSSLIELNNGEWISGGGDGALRRWRDGKPVGDGQPIPTGQGAVWSLIQLSNGELISGGQNGTLRRWRTTPGWPTLLPLACAKLEHHPTLTRLPWLNSARATCHQLVWRYRQP